MLGEGYITQVNNMIDLYGDLDVLESREGIPNDPDFPDVIYVESRLGAPGGAAPDVADTPKVTILSVDEIPYDRGLYVGPVERVRRRE